MMMLENVRKILNARNKSGKVKGEQKWLIVICSLLTHYILERGTSEHQHIKKLKDGFIIEWASKMSNGYHYGEELIRRR